MAVAVYATDLADITLAESGTFVELTNWTAGTPSTGYETDYFIQGTACKSSTVKTTQNSLAIDFGGTITIPANGAILIWNVLFAPNSLASYALGGLRACVGNATTAFKMWFTGGNDKSPNPYGGWVNIAIDPTVESGAITLAVSSTNSTFTRSSGSFLTNGFEPGMNILITGCTNAGNNSRRVILTVDATVITVTDNTGMVTESGTGDEQVRFCDAVEGSPSTTNQVVGVAAYLPTTYPSKGAPFGLDAIRYGRCEMRVNEGAVATPATFTGMAAKNDQNEASNYNRWGLFRDQGGSYLWKGLMTLGYGATDVYFVDANKVINVADTPAVRRAFNTISIERAGSTVSWTNCVFAALGMRSRGTLTMAAAANVDITGCLFKDMDLFTFLSSAAILNCNFVGCNEIDSGGASFVGSNILIPTVAADSYALYWNAAADSDGYLDSMSFSKGTNAHHAIRFGTSSSTTIGLREIAFSGFHASNGNNDSALYFADKGIDTIWNVTLYGCSGDISYKKARSGDTVNLSYDPLTIKVTVLDENNNPIENAQTSIWKASDNTQLMNEDTLATGIAQESYSGSTPMAVIVKVRKSDTTDNPRYYSYSGADTITTTGLSKTVTLKVNSFI